MVNPITTLLSAKLILDYPGEKEAGIRIKDADDCIIDKDGVLTPDMGGENTTDQIAEAIIHELLP
jgi:isocitrate/isopropylmalate dehydrogenase